MAITSISLTSVVVLLCCVVVVLCCVLFQVLHNVAVILRITKLLSIVVVNLDFLMMLFQPD